MLKVGEIFKTAEGLWYVESVTMSGAHCIGLSAFEAAITTRKRVTKIVRRHKRMRVFSANACVEIVDPKTLDQVRVRKRIKMARKREAEAQGNGETETTQEARPQAVRETQRYQRTDKAPKSEMRGQGKIVLDALNAASGPVTVGELAAQIGSFEGSKQSAERVVGYYISKFKRDGLLTVVAAPEAEPATV